MDWKEIDADAVDITKQPWDGQSVLIAIGSENLVGEAYYDYERKEWNWANTHWTDPTSHSVIHITHWMPLPAPPKI